MVEEEAVVEVEGQEGVEAVEGQLDEGEGEVGHEEEQTLQHWEGC